MVYANENFQPVGDQTYTYITFPQAIASAKAAKIWFIHQRPGLALSIANNLCIYSGRTLHHTNDRHHPFEPTKISLTSVVD